MQPQSKSIPQPMQENEEVILQQPYVRQVEDRALPARQVLIEQREVPSSETQVRAFVP